MFVICVICFPDLARSRQAQQSQKYGRRNSSMSHLFIPTREIYRMFSAACHSRFLGVCLSQELCCSGIGKGVLFGGDILNVFDFMS